MRFGLRVQLVGALIGATLISGIVSAIAARQTMAVDLNKLAIAEVETGATGYGGYWDAKRDAVKLLVTQAAIEDIVKKATARHDGNTLGTVLTGIAKQGGLSFLTVVDAHGTVLARANGGETGVKLTSPFVERALSGETINTPAKLPHDELAPEQLVPQIESTTAGREGLVEGLGLIAATPISDENERTIGAVYGGIVLDHYYDVVDQSARSLGGKAGVIFDGEMISSSLLRPDGTRFVDDAASAKTKNVTQPFTGVDTEAGSTYLVRVDPILNDDNHVVAARWYGVPLSKYTTIQSHTLLSLVIWGIVGIVIALLAALPFVERLSRQLVRRSRQVRDSAKELSVVIVGSEVSGDHVAQTRAAVERQGELLMQLAAETTAAPPSGGVGVARGLSETVLSLSELNAEILGDVIVIDTLATEMAERTLHAVTRVNELNEVAAGLDELVNG